MNKVGTSTELNGILVIVATLFISHQIPHIDMLCSAHRSLIFPLTPKFWNAFASKERTLLAFAASPLPLLRCKIELRRTYQHATKISHNNNASTRKFKHKSFTKQLQLFSHLHQDLIELRGKYSVSFSFVSVWNRSRNIRSSVKYLWFCLTRFDWAFS